MWWVRGVRSRLLSRRASLGRAAQVAAQAGLPLVCPPVRLCTDNGVMVAWTGQLRLRLGLCDRPLTSTDDIDLHVEARTPAPATSPPHYCRRPLLRLL